MSLTRSGGIDWTALCAAAVVVFGTAVLIPRFALFVAAASVFVLVVRLRYTAGWSSASSACLGAVIAALVYGFFVLISATSAEPATGSMSTSAHVGSLVVGPITI